MKQDPPIKERPYIYLTKEKDNYTCHVAMYLDGWMVDGSTIKYNEVLTKHDNPDRTIRDEDNHYYAPHMYRTILELTLDKDEYVGWWTKSFAIPKQYIHDLRPNDPTVESFCDSMVHVLVDLNNGESDHDGSSTGHYGDAD